MMGKMINSINNKTGELTIDPGSSGDSGLQFSLSGTGKFKIGVDDSDSDIFKISSGSALGTTDTYKITSDGYVTKPLQSAFLAVLSSDLENVTGDGTEYNIVWNSEIFDQNGDLSSGVFTAPVTGRYMLSISILEYGTPSYIQGYGGIITSNKTYRAFEVHYGQGSMFSGMGVCAQCLVDMDAADTAKIMICIDGNPGNKVCDIIEDVTDGELSTGKASYFSGYLAC